MANINEILRKSLSFRIEDERYWSLRERGILFLDEEIDEGAFSKFSRDLVYLATGGSVIGQEVNNTGRDLRTVWIILNSPGGDVLYGIGIHDCIKMLVNKGIAVNILSMGMAASMATIILQAGTTRLALPYTQFLIHQVSETILFSSEEVNESKERVEEMERINKIMIGLLAQRVGMDVDELLKKTYKKNFWLDCRGALELGQHGLIDEVVTKLPF